MKKSWKIFLALSLLVLSTTLDAQEQPVKTISVYGSAEKSIVPNEIFFTLNITEYTEENKQKVSIEELESELMQVAKDVGIPIKNIEIKNLTGYQYYAKANGSGYAGSKSLEILKIEVLRDNDYYNIYTDNYSTKYGLENTNDKTSLKHILFKYEVSVTFSF